MPALSLAIVFPESSRTLPPFFTPMIVVPLKTASPVRSFVQTPGGIRAFTRSWGPRSSLFWRPGLIWRSGPSPRVFQPGVQTWWPSCISCWPGLPFDGNHPEPTSWNLALHPRADDWFDGTTTAPALSAMTIICGVQCWPRSIRIGLSEMDCGWPAKFLRCLSVFEAVCVPLVLTRFRSSSFAYVVLNTLHPRHLSDRGQAWFKTSRCGEKGHACLPKAKRVGD